jgi:hypothetical protein
MRCNGARRAASTSPTHLLIAANDRGAAGHGCKRYCEQRGQALANLPGGCRGQSVFFPCLVTVLRICAIWTAPWNSIHGGAWTTLMARVTRRPWPLVETRRAGTFCHRSAFHARYKVGWFRLAVKT